MRRHVQGPRQRLRIVRSDRRIRQCLPHLLYQQSVAPVLQHRQWQSALQHLLQSLYITAQRQGQVTCIKPDLGLHGIELQRPGEHQPIRLYVRRRGKRKTCALQRNARIHIPAGQAVDVAQHVDQAELANPAGGFFFNGDGGGVAGGAQAQGDVVGNQCVVTAPAFQGNAQVG